ncbi:MAG: sensor histidine kinase [Suipraeoptans sp.]
MKRGTGKKTNKLQSKLTRIVLAVILIAFFLVFIIVTYNMYSNYRSQEINNQRYQLDRAVAQITSYQETINNIAKQVIYDDVIQKGITTAADSSGDYLYQMRNAQTTLGNYLNIVEGVHEIMIYTSDERTFTSRNIKDPFRPENNSWYENFINSGRTSGFTEVHQSEQNQDGSRVEVISYIVSYYSIENAGLQLGKLIINIEFDIFKKMAKLDNALLNGYGLFDSSKDLLIKEGEIDLEYDEIMEQNQEDLITENGENVIIISKNMSDDWIFATEISGHELMKKSVSVCLYLLIIFILVVIVLFFVLHRLISSIVHPINQLSESAEEVGKGNFDISVNINTNDEIEMLTDVFNKMVVDIKDYMDQSVEHEKLRRRMQIENLMLQINPHFIYNTINSIVYMAKMSGNEEIVDFSNAFISLLQSTLDVRDSIYNSVDKELSTVENYLCLQKYRYEDKFKYKIECEDNLKQCQILNVMLQPAVENAIFHGIAPKDKEGLLLIVVKREGDTLVVIIGDNGIGMENETIEEVLKPERTEFNGIRKIGVANVRDRIKEIYGEPYELTIHSELGVGTEVIMKVPYIKNSEE